METTIEVKQFDSLIDMINFMQEHAKGKHILEISKVVPECLILDFDDFMVGKTRTTLDGEPAVHMFDYKAYINRILRTGIDYSLQFSNNTQEDKESIVEIDNLFNDFIESLIGKEVTVYLHDNYTDALQRCDTVNLEDVTICKAEIQRTKYNPITDFSDTSMNGGYIHCEVVILDTKKYKHRVYNYFKYF